MRPCEASVRLAKEDARESGVYGERERMCVGMSWSGWGVYAGGIMAGVFVARGLLSRVFTADKRCSEHPQVCHCAKCERNQTIPGRVIAI